ncbi:MAG: class I SAM-dependent methyltransferase [Planctomycetota bacterium]
MRTDERPRILDLGPGGGVNLPVLLPRGDVTCVDLDAGSLARVGEQGARGLRADASRLPIGDGSADAICALDVLEHLDDDVGALADWHRALAPEGLLLLSVPALDLLWGRQDVLAEHRRRYDRATLRTRLLDAGFELERLTYFNTLLFPPVLGVRLAMRPWLGRASEGGSDLGLRLPGWIEELLFRTFSAEGAWLERRDLPIGVSLMAVARPRRDGR